MGFAATPTRTIVKEWHGNVAYIVQQTKTVGSYVPIW